MRLTTGIAVALLAVTPASAQDQYPYGLDPYNPSDAWLLRNYGATLVAQTPLLEFRKLDPYNPHHAALLRQLGGAIPLWGTWYPFPSAPARAPLTLFPQREPDQLHRPEPSPFLPQGQWSLLRGERSPLLKRSPRRTPSNTPWDWPEERPARRLDGTLLSDPIQVYGPQIFYPWQWQPYPPVYSHFRRPLRGWGY